MWPRLLTYNFFPYKIKFYVNHILIGYSVPMKQNRKIIAFIFLLSPLKDLKLYNCESMLTLFFFVLLTVGLYSSNNDEPLFLLREHSGGITQLKFTSDGFYLFSGARKVNIMFDSHTNIVIFSKRICSTDN